MVESGVEVPQHPLSGKYVFYSNISVPDQPPCFSNISDNVESLSDVLHNGTDPICRASSEPANLQQLLPETASSLFDASDGCLLPSDTVSNSVVSVSALQIYYQNVRGLRTKVDSFFFWLSVNVIMM